MWSRMTHARNGAGRDDHGALTVIVWKQFGWLGLYEIIPGFLFGSIGIVVFSLLGKAPSAAMQQRFAEADAHYHSARRRYAPPLNKNGERQNAFSRGRRNAVVRRLLRPRLRLPSS